jgi:heptosyltransferase-2
MKNMSENFKNIIVRLPNWVGDVAMATPFLRALRRSFPGARISCLALPYVNKIIGGSPLFDEFIPFLHKGIFKDLHMGRELRARGFDFAVILPDSFTSAFVMWVAKIPRRVGYAAQSRGWMLTNSVEQEKENGRKKPVSMVEYYMAVGRKIGCVDAGSELELPISEESRRRAAEFFRENNLEGDSPVVGFNIGAAFGSSKLWPPAHFAKAADLVCERLGAKAVIFCGPGEERIADETAGLMKQPAVNTSKNIVPLDDLKAYIAECGLLVTTDSGPRHFAVASGIPVVVVMGPTDKRYTESNVDRTIVIQAEVACGPCHKKICPVENHPCMTRTTPEQVFDAASELFKRFNLCHRKKH